MTVFITSVLLLCLYFLPSLVAARARKRNSAAIFLFNLFLGWTLIGWIVALIWSATKDSPKSHDQA